MIRYTEYSDNEAAPTLFVNGVGSIFKIGENSVQVVFVRRLKNAEGEWVTHEVARLIWDEQDWLHAGQLFRYAMEAYQVGMPMEDEMRREGLQ